MRAASPSYLSLLLPAFLLLIYPIQTHSKVGSKTFDTFSSWNYIDRFVFIPTPENDIMEKGGPNTEDGLAYIRDNFGLIDFKVQFATTSRPSLLLYYGTFDDWNEIYTSTTTCLERYEKAPTKLDLSIRGSAVKDVHASTLEFSGRDMTEASGYVYFTANVPQWFFLVISNCQPQGAGTDKDRCDNQGYCQGPTIAKVEYSFTNGASISHKHFSYDHFGLRPMYITFFVFQILLCAVCKFVRGELLAVNKYHVTVRMLVTSITATALSHLLNVAAYEEMANKGIENNELLTVASFIFNISDLIFVYLLIFLAKGWTLVRYKISSTGRIKLTVLMTFTFFASVALDSWKSYGYDEAMTSFFYATPPGACFLWLRVITTVWFFYCCWTTQKSFESKRRFFFRFKVFFGLWISSKPALAWICQYGLDDNIRMKYVLSWEVALLFMAHSVLISMYIPKKQFNKGFPFHKVSSTMLGLVQGQSASEFIRDQQENGDPNAPNGNPNQPDSPNQRYEGGLFNIRHAKHILKTSGMEMHRTVSTLKDAADDLMVRLRDLDDYEGQDISYSREQFSRMGQGGQSMPDLDEFNT